MAITLTWKEFNYGESEQRIYRSETTMDPQLLPTPLDTIAANLVQYVDNTAVEGTSYYYRVSALVDGVEVVSSETFIAGSSVLDVIVTMETTSTVGTVNQFIWNGSPLNGLQDVNGMATPLGIEYVSGAISGTGTYTDTLYPDIDWPLSPALNSRDYEIIFYNGTQSANFKFTGLTPGKAYDLKFIGERHSTSGRGLSVTVGGVNQHTSVAYNTGLVDLEFLGEVADANGEIAFSANYSEAYVYTYFSAVYIHG